MPKYASSAQIRAARGLLGWSRSVLAENVGVSRQTIDLIENRDEARNIPTRERAQAIMEQHGIKFMDADDADGEGVRFAGTVRRRDIPSS
jgi:DNA-binding XRE family transcriptional regulator